MADDKTLTFDPVRYPMLADRDWLYERYVVRGLGPTAIAKEIGCKTTTSVLRALGFAGIPLRGRHGPKRTWEPTKEDLLAAYHEAGSQRALARHRGLSQGTIRNVFVRLGLHAEDFEPNRTIFSKHPQLRDKERIEDLFRRMPGTRAAKELGVPISALAEAASQHGLSFPNGGAPLETRELGIRLYGEGLPLREVAAIVGYDPAAVFRWLRKAGVDTSTRTRRKKSPGDRHASRHTLGDPFRIQSPGGDPNTCPGCGDICDDYVSCHHCWVRLPAQLPIDGRKTTWRSTLASRPGWRETSKILDAATAWLDAHPDQREGD